MVLNRKKVNKMERIFLMINMLVICICCFILNSSISNLTKTANEILKYSQPEEIKLIEDKYILGENDVL